MMRVVLLTLALVTATFAVSYDGDIVLRVTPRSEEHVSILKHLRRMLERRDLKHYDFWSDASAVNVPELIHVAKDSIDNAMRDFTAFGLEFETSIGDLGAYIAAEKRAPRGQKIDWTAYPEYEDIIAFLEDAATSQDYVSLSSIGQSYEGRDIWLLRINKPNSNGDPKESAFIDFNIHAREWVTSAAGTWMVNQLLSGSYDEVLEQWDFHIVVVLNPDGFLYTKTDDRLWRKTRSDHDSILGCLGADPNRNWDWSFGGEGTSANKCSDLYHGPNAFSESETKAASDYIMGADVTFKTYISFHSYSQFILLPFGDTDEEPPDYEEMMVIGLIGQEAILGVHGTQYRTDTIPNLLYPAAGGSIDWTKGALEIKWSYAFELRDTGDYGFLLPPDQIIPTGEETLVGLLAMLEAIRLA